MTTNAMQNFVALVNDARSVYAWVYVQASSWDEACDLLENAGSEVVDDLTEEYKDCDFNNPKDLEKSDLLTLEQLKIHPDFAHF
jgi:hypothetical protein